jgi:hypothetical protein
MPRRGVINSALFNFLGTYTSRYSAFNGYWLFGFLVGDGVRLEFDLLAQPPAADGSAKSRAAVIAIERFHNQMRKARIASAIEAAKLVLETNSGRVRRPVNGWEHDGFLLTASVHALVGGAWRHRQTTFFVAPFDGPWRASGSFHRDSGESGWA